MRKTMTVRRRPNWLAIKRLLWIRNYGVFSPGACGLAVSGLEA